MSGPTSTSLRKYAANHPRTRQPKRLADFDRLAGRAAEIAAERFKSEAWETIALARERFLQGYDLYPDGPLFKMSIPQLRLETREENADAINYIVQELVLEEEHESSSRPEPA
jgi:hypothetical protein